MPTGAASCRGDGGVEQFDKTFGVAERLFLTLLEDRLVKQAFAELVSAGGSVRAAARTPAQRRWAAAQAAARRTGAVDPRRAARRGTRLYCFLYEHHSAN